MKKKNLKLPTTSMALDLLGKSVLYDRVKALEQWAVSHGYKGYKSIKRASKMEKALQTKMRLQ